MPEVGDRLSKGSKTVKLLPFAAVAAASFIAYYLLNISTPPFGDDIYLVFNDLNLNEPGFMPERISSLREILANLINYYLGYRGRLVAEGLAMLFAVYGKQYFNVVNASVFTGMTALVYFHTNYGKKPNWILYFLVCAVFWFFTPNLTNSYLWMVCSIYAVWPVFFILLFLVPYRIVLSDRGLIRRPKLAALFIVPAGFIAGTLNEQSFGLSIGFSALTIFVLLLRKRKIPVWSVVGLVSAICGMLLLFLSPGYQASTVEEYSEPPLKLFFSDLPFRIYGAATLSFRVTWVLMLISAAVLLWLIADIKKSAAENAKNKKKGKHAQRLFSLRSLISNQNGLMIPGFFFLTLIASSVITLALPYFENRLFITVFACAALVFFSLLCEAAARIDQSAGKVKSAVSNRYLRIALPALMILVTLFDYGKEYRIYHQHYEVYTEVVASIEKQIAAGEKNIVVHNVTQIPQKLLPEGRLRSIIGNWSVTGLTVNEKEPMNVWYAYYFGADTIKGERNVNDPPVSEKDGIIAGKNY